MQLLTRQGQYRSRGPLPLHRVKGLMLSEPLAGDKHTLARPHAEQFLRPQPAFVQIAPKSKRLEQLRDDPTSGA